MTEELATHISLLAAPIFAAMLSPQYAASTVVSVEKLAELRRHAIIQAHALWLETRDIQGSV